MLAPASAGAPSIQRPVDRRDETRRALNGRALHVVPDAPHAAEFLGAASPARAAMGRDPAKGEPCHRSRIRTQAVAIITRPWNGAMADPAPAQYRDHW